MQKRDLLTRKGLAITALLAVALLLGAMSLADLGRQTAAAKVIPAAPAQIYTLQGRVYERR